jgi:hypothetical protein
MTADEPQLATRGQQRFLRAVLFVLVDLMVLNLFAEHWDRVVIGSKFVILEAVDLVFDDRVDLGGLIPFIVLVVAMLAAEAIVQRTYDAIG